MEGQLILEGFENQMILNEKKKETIVKPELKEWTYTGPFYRFNRYVDSVFNMGTMAISKAQASNNIRAQIKKQLGLSYRSVLTIDETLLHEVYKEG